MGRVSEKGWLVYVQNNTITKNSCGLLFIRPILVVCKSPCKGAGLAEIHSRVVRNSRERNHVYIETRQQVAFADEAS